jgi:hypothetical protein
MLANMALRLTIEEQTVNTIERKTRSPMLTWLKTNTNIDLSDLRLYHQQ